MFNDGVVINDLDPVEVIRSMMSENGVTHKQLAEALGTTRQNVGEMLNNKSKNVGLKRFCSIANALGYEVRVEKR